MYSVVIKGVKKRKSINKSNTKIIMVRCCSRRLLCSAKSLLEEFTAMAILKNETRIGMYDRKVCVSTQRRLDPTRVFESACAKIVFENRLYGEPERDNQDCYIVHRKLATSGISLAAAAETRIGALLRLLPPLITLTLPG